MKNIKQINGISKNLKATIVFAVASFATSGINYITTPIFTRLLSLSEYGIVSVYNSWYSIIQVFASMSLIYPGVLNVGLHDHETDRWGYLSNMLAITSVLTLFWGIIYFIFKNQINQLLSLPTSLVVLMLMMCFITPATTFWTYKQRYEINYKIVFWVSIGSAVIAQIISVISVVVVNKYNSTVNLGIIRLWSAGIVNMLVALVLYIYIMIKGKKIFSKDLWKITFLVSIPLIPHYLGSVILSSTDKIMISLMVGDDKTGIYSLAAILSAVGVLVWRALSVIFTPYVNKNLGERNFKDIRIAVKPLLILVGAFCVITALAAPEIIKILATKEYLEGIFVVPPIAAGIYLHALYDNFTAVSFFNKKSIRIMLATISAALANIALNYICIKKWGYIAAGYTTLISNILLTVFHYINSRIIEKEKVFDSRFSFISSIIVIILCLLCNLLYKENVIYIIIRYFTIAVILFIIIKQRKFFIEGISSMKL